MVATIVLIVVAIIGTVTIGAILGAFSHDVSGQLTADNIQAKFSSPLTIGGSMDLMPVSELLAAVFQKAHPALELTSVAMELKQVSRQLRVVHLISAHLLQM